MASVISINLLLANHFHQQIGELALLIAGCDNSKRLILYYYISTNSLKMEILKIILLVITKKNQKNKSTLNTLGDVRRT